MDGLGRHDGLGRTDVKAITVRAPGDADQLVVAELPDPVPVDGELLVDVAATAVNRADVLQRRGRYPPPPGASDVLGLEMAGTVAQVGTGVAGWRPGDEVCAVLPGGGYAERVALPAACAMPPPPGLTLLEAAAVPEVWTTAYDNLFNRGRLAAGETVLLHGGSSGVGTAAIQLAVRAGCRVLVTAGSPAKLAACRRLGAAAGINYHDEDFSERVHALTDGRGVDVILDIIGADYLDANLRSLAIEGRLLIIGLMGGARATVPLDLLLSRRLTVCASTLRARPVRDKAALAAQLVQEVWPGFADGSLRPVIDRVLPLAAAAQAHRVLEDSVHIGKIVLQVHY
jgi:putative PIG3 family NAD(P)H quinone oxidoreductase